MFHMLCVIIKKLHATCTQNKLNWSTKSRFIRNYIWKFRNRNASCCHVWAFIVWRGSASLYSYFLWGPLNVLHIRIKYMFHIPRRTLLLLNMPLQAQCLGICESYWDFNSDLLMFCVVLERSPLSPCCNGFTRASFGVKRAWLYFKFLEGNKRLTS